jgi:hypothetical protein
VYNPDGTPVPEPHHQHSRFVAVVLEAWRTQNDPNGYYNELLDPATTKGALAKFNINVANPVVLTEDDYNRGYQKADVSEIVFVLPKPPVGGNATASMARDLMAAVPFGM